MLGEQKWTNILSIVQREEVLFMSQNYINILNFKAILHFCIQKNVEQNSQ